MMTKILKVKMAIPNPAESGQYIYFEKSIPVTGIESAKDIADSVKEAGGKMYTSCEYCVTSTEIL